MGVAQAVTVARLDRILYLDFETRSECNLKKAGAAEYARHPSTEILCVAFRFDPLTGPKTRTWNAKLDPYGPGRNQFLGVLQYVVDHACKIVAHGAMFEQLVIEHVIPRQIETCYKLDLKQWICTAAMAAAHALPRDLEKACIAMELKARKNPIGKKLIRKHSVPQKLNKEDKALGVTVKWDDDPEGLRGLESYCREDVIAMRELFHSLPMLTPDEAEIWRRNQRTNKRGLHIDRKLVKSALKMIAKEAIRLNARTVALTKGRLETANQRNAVLKFLSENGLKLPNLQKETIENALSTGLATGKARELLQIRQAISKTSTAKYVGFELRTRSDSRLRDFALYHGASTGRDTGSGVQIHNLTKPTIDDIPGATKVILEGDYEWARALYGNNLLEVLASIIRGVITATPGWRLFVGDLNAIEARVLFWIAGHERGLQMFRNGEDLYVDLATVIYDLSPLEIDAAMRDLGKRGILGGGFGMGGPKFKTTCKKYGRDISSSLAKKTIKAYRTKHKPVTVLWSNIERAAIAAVRNPGKTFAVNKTRWFVRKKFLYCELPSGRRLAYFGAKVKMRTTPWGALKPELSHWGVDPKSKRWVFTHTYGGRLTENVVQAIARDVMTAGQANTERAGYVPLHSIYDELVNERRKRLGGSVRAFESLMISPMPAWADGLPLVAKGYQAKRYRKG